MLRALVLLVLLGGFDHAKHDAAAKIACADCHATKKTLAAMPAHAQCFGKCHGPAPTLPPRGKKLVVEPARLAVCTTCHTQTALDAGTKQALAQRVPRSLPDFELAVGHKRHAAVPCAQCHTQQRPAPHARCASCHDGTKAKVAMTGCASCHVTPTGPSEPDARPLVRSAFSHAKHAARGAAGAKCATCHSTASETDARELPHATAATCAIGGCHDDRAAFPITESCTRCHQDVPKGKYEVARPDTRFSHGTHLAFTALVGCATCHAVAKSGEVGLAGHEACAPCHADDFHLRKPVTCGACHDATEPWRKLLPDRPSLQSSEFGASLDHGKHRAACASCHSLTTATAQLRPPRGHRACTGKGCHTASGGAAPAFTSCAGCHELGLAEQREVQRATATWSVRRLFTHDMHARTECAACHVDMSGRDLLSIATPPKSTCVSCHDGQTSFKVTGTDCARCHPKN